MKYANQHFITEAYLRAWCDPHTPNGAFVWRVSVKDHSISKKSPKSLFAELDFYTTYDSKGNRILDVEHKLQEIEGKFIALRDKKILSHQQLTAEDRKTIAFFISSIFARTKRQKEDDLQIWQDYFRMVETLPLEIAGRIKETLEYRHVLEQDSKQPMPFHLSFFVNATAPYLYSMNCAIYETETEPGFITSDDPCVWFDPAIYNPNIPLTFFGIGSPTLNILFPISPRQYISLEKNGLDGYIDLHSHPNETELVDCINGLIVLNSQEYIVVSQNIVKKEWFLDNQK